MGSLIAEGFALGLSLGLSCIGTCLPVFLPFLIGEKRSWKKNLLYTAYFLLGRFAGYIAFGAVFGALGGTLSAGLRELITACAFIVLGGVLLFYTFRKDHHEGHCHHSKFEKVATHPAILGLLIGISPCPSFLLGLSRALSTGGALDGAIFFTGFFFGTSLFYLPVSIFGEFGRLKFFRWISRAAALVIGLWFLGNGLITLWGRTFARGAGNIEVVEISHGDTVYIAGPSDLVLYLKDIHHFESGPIETAPDSVPDGAWLFSIGETPDTAALIGRGVKIIAADPDSAAVERMAKHSAHHAFRRYPPKGFYFKVK